MKTFPTKRGMNIHRSRHAKEANSSTAKGISSRLNKSPTDDSDQKKDENNLNKAGISSDCKKWGNVFCVHESNENFDERKFDKDIEDFLEFLYVANEKLPGPQHPAVKFYRLRKKKKQMNITSAQHSRSSNPQRTDAKAKQRRRDQYHYDLTQY